MVRGSIRLACWSVLAILPASEEICAQDAVPGALPADTLLFAEIDLAGMLAGIDQLDIVRLFRDDEVREFLAPAVEAMSAKIRQLQAGLFLLRSYGLPQIIGGRISLALLGVGLPQADGGIEWTRGRQVLEPDLVARIRQAEWVLPDLVVCIETSGRAAFESSLHRILELSPYRIESVDSRQGGVALRRTTVEFPGRETRSIGVHHGFVAPQDTRFLLATREESWLSVRERLGPEGATGETLAGSDPFRSWQHTGLRGTDLVRVYATVEGLLELLLPRTVRGEGDGVAPAEALRNSGLATIQAAGYALGVDGGRIRESLTLVLPEQKTGVLALLDALQPTADLGTSIPATSAAALALGLDPSRLVDRWEHYLEETSESAHATYRQHLEQARQELGVDLRGDLIGSIGSAARIFARLPSSGLVPEVEGEVQLLDGKRFWLAFRRLEQVAAERSGGSLEVAGFDLPDGNAGSYWKLAGVPVSPAFAVSGESLRFGLTPRTVRRTLGQQDRPPPKVREVTNLDHCLRSFSASQAETITGLFYLDLPALAGFGLETATPFLGSAFRDLPFELDVSAMPFPETIASYLSGLLLTLRTSERAITLDAASPVGGLLFPLALPALLLAPRSVAPGDPFVREVFQDEGRPADDTEMSSAYLGLAPAEAGTAGTTGLLIASIAPGSPAESAGLLAGDRILALDDRPIQSAEQLSTALASQRPGAEVLILVQRSGELYTFPVVLGLRK